MHTMSEGEICGEIFKRRGQYCSVEWKIRDFYAKMARANIKLRSQKFRFCGGRWRVVLQSDSPAWCQHPEDCVFVQLYKEGPESITHDGLFSLGVKLNNGGIYKKNDFIHQFKSRGCGGVVSLINVGELIENERIVAVDGMVTFFCILQLNNQSKVEESLQMVDDLRNLGQDFKDMFQTGQCSDITIVVKGQKFNVHSQILAARSPVFATMLKHDMKEKNTGVIEIVEYDPDTFREFLLFLYCGEAVISPDNVVDLYCAAEKYVIKQLKSLCGSFIRQRMSEENFCDLYSLGLRYNDKELIDYSEEFFSEHVKSIIKTPRWMSFAQEFPLEANKLFIQIVEQLMPH